ncbi:MAG: hypothetical protein ACLUB3_08200 [Clostridium sp.]
MTWQKHYHFTKNMPILDYTHINPQEIYEDRSLKTFPGMVAAIQMASDAF